MSRKKGAGNGGSIRQRPDGRWEARVTVGTDPATGRPVRRSFYGKTQREVKRLMTDALHAIDTGTYREPSRLTVKAWCLEWLETYCKGTLKPYTVASYRGVIENHIAAHIGAMRLQDVRGVHIQRMINALVSGGAAPKTVRNIYSIAHKAFRVAVKQGLLAANPCDAAELPKAQRKEIKPLADAEIPLFLQAIQGDSMENAFALCLLAGLREGECLGLSWRQIDWEKRTITVDQQLQREKTKGGGYYIAPFTKSSRPRTILPPEIAFTYLRAQQRRQLEERLAAGSLWSNPDGLVFTGQTGSHLAIFTFYSHFKKIAARIGRPDARPHDLRHTAATVAIASGADIKSVQDMLGHATASFTLNVYAHTSERMMADTARRMQSYYEGIGK